MENTKQAIRLPANSHLYFARCNRCGGCWQVCDWRSAAHRSTCDWVSLPPAREWMAEYPWTPRQRQLAESLKGREYLL